MNNFVLLLLILACPDGYKLFNQSCYGITWRGVHDWEDARVACGELTKKFSSFYLSFDLVSIHNDEENSFILNNVTNGECCYYLGLRRNVNESDFQWSDQSKFSYEDWRQDYPKREVNKFQFYLIYFYFFILYKISKSTFRILFHFVFNCILSYSFYYKESLDACATMSYYPNNSWSDSSCDVPTYRNYHYLCKGVFTGKFCYLIMI